MKVCSYCARKLSKDLFHKKSSSMDGLMPMCKDCNKKRVAKYYSLNKEKAIKASELWTSKNKDKVNGYKKEWKEKNKHNSLYKLKRWSRATLQRAVKNNKVIKCDCEYPNCNNDNTEAHHRDYSKPLDVIWFCRKHHILADKTYQLIH